MELHKANCMRITQEDLTRRLNSEQNLVNQLGLRLVPKPVAVNTPQIKGDIIRSVAGSLAIIDKPANVVKAFEMTPNQVHSAAHSEKATVKEAVKASVSRVQELALNRLMESLNLLTPESLVGEKPRDLARIASDLSRVIDRTSPRDSIQHTQLIVYAPQRLDVNRFQVVDI